MENITHEDKIINHILNSDDILAYTYWKKFKDRYECLADQSNDFYLEENKLELEIPSFCGKLICLESALTELIENKALEKEHLQRIFSAVEDQLYHNPDPEIRGAFETCFFESILNYIGHGRLKKEDIEEYLGPISRELCIQNQEFWGTNELEIDDKK